MAFCAAHGEAARIGAALEEYEYIHHYIERLLNPEVPAAASAIARALKSQLASLHGVYPSDAA